MVASTRTSLTRKSQYVRSNCATIRRPLHDNICFVPVSVVDVTYPQEPSQFYTTRRRHPLYSSLCKIESVAERGMSSATRSSILPLKGRAALVSTKRNKRRNPSGVVIAAVSTSTISDSGENHCAGRCANAALRLATSGNGGRTAAHIHEPQHQRCGEGDQQERKQPFRHDW